MNINTISHTSWNCKYHIVFAPKYRRKAFYGGRRLEIGSILKELCKRKEIPNRGRGMSRPYSHVTGNTTKIFSKQYHGISQRQKQSFDI